MPGSEARKTLRQRGVSDKPCGYPTCKGFALFSEEGDVTDCCYKHSMQNSDTHNSIPNDGIIDDQAIEIALEGSRPVNLTWVEKDIALGKLLAAGGTFCNARDLLGLQLVARRDRAGRRGRVALKLARHFNPDFEAPDGD